MKKSVSSGVVILIIAIVVIIVAVFFVKGAGPGKSKDQMEKAIMSGSMGLPSSANKNAPTMPTTK